MSDPGKGVWGNAAKLNAVKAAPPTKPVSPSDSYTAWERATNKPYMNNLPTWVTVNGETWYRTTTASDTGTYSYCYAISQGNADVNAGTYDHVTVVPAGPSSSLIGNLHYTLGGTATHDSYVYQPYDNLPGQDCRSEVRDVFYRLFMRKVTYSAQKPQSASKNTGSPGSGGNIWPALSLTGQ